VTENSDSVPGTIDGHSMATWIVSLSTLRNMALPMTEDGILLLRPQITWGGGKKLVGDEVALWLPAEGQKFSPDEQVGVPIVTQLPADDQL